MTDARPDPSRPVLVVFSSRGEGLSRRTEGHLAQVLQRRGNHDTFRLHHVLREEHPELFERLHVEQTPTLLVMQGTRVVGRLSLPRGAEEIQRFLAPWLT